MPIRLPALPALVAARALEADATRAAHRVLEDIQTLLFGYDLVVHLLDDLPPKVREAGTAALARRLVAADLSAQACQDRLDEAREFRDTFQAVDSPVEMVEVPVSFFEMLSPYLDDAMEPVREVISRRAGCPADEVDRIFANHPLAA